MLSRNRRLRYLTPEAVANVFSSLGSDLTLRKDCPDEEDINAAAELCSVLAIPNQPKRPRRDRFGKKANK